MKQNIKSIFGDKIDSEDILDDDSVPKSAKESMLRLERDIKNSEMEEAEQQLRLEDSRQRLTEVFQKNNFGLLFNFFKFWN
jgi:hypothetical protein